MAEKGGDLFHGGCTQMTGSDTSKRSKPLLQEFSCCSILTVVRIKDKDLHLQLQIHCGCISAVKTYIFRGKTRFCFGRWNTETFLPPEWEFTDQRCGKPEFCLSWVRKQLQYLAWPLIFLCFTSAQRSGSGHGARLWGELNATSRFRFLLAASSKHFMSVKATQWQGSRRFIQMMHKIQEIQIYIWLLKKAVIKISY